MDFMGTSRLTRKPSPELLRYVKRAAEHGMHVHLQRGPLDVGRDVRQHLGIDDRAFVTTFFSGSRPGNNPELGRLAADIAGAIAGAGHATTLSGGGCYHGLHPDHPATGLMGNIAYGMCTNGNGHFLISEGLLLSEGLPQEAQGRALCLVENGGGLRLTERESGLIIPSNSIIAFEGAIGTSSESLTDMTMTVIQDSRNNNDRANHRTLVLVSLPNKKAPVWYLDEQGRSFAPLLHIVRNALDKGLLYNVEQLNRSVLVYEPHPLLDDAAIARDLRALNAFLHFRASRINPHLVEPLRPESTRALGTPLMGKVRPLIVAGREHLDIREIPGWKEHIPAFEKMAKQPLVVERPFHYGQCNA